MRLSTELLLTNIVLLVAIWYCAYQGTITHMIVAGCLLPVMFLLRFLGVRAVRRETEEATARLRASIKALRERQKAEKS